LAQLPPPQTPPATISPDGQWRWDGQRWVPNLALAPVAYPIAPAGMVAPKNPAVSLLVSFFIPGVGSMINGDTTTGVIILVLYIAGVVGAFFLIGIPVVIGAWIWGLIDAYQGAVRWNARHGIRS
jgi:TM2 domain-containing membrane protein YozV